MSAAAIARHRLAGLRILVVENNPLDLAVIRALLRNHGATVLEANDGSAGVAAVQSQCDGVDLVLMDVHLPVLGGLPATRAIRALPGLAGMVPILALTADGLDMDRAECLAAGMDGHLHKGSDLAAMLDTVEAWATGRRGLSGSWADTDGDALWRPQQALQRAGGDIRLHRAAVDLLQERLAMACHDLPDLMHPARDQALRTLLDELAGAAWLAGADRLARAARDALDLLEDPSTERAGACAAVLTLAVRTWSAVSASVGSASAVR